MDSRLPGLALAILAMWGYATIWGTFAADVLARSKNLDSANAVAREWARDQELDTAVDRPDLEDL